MFILMLKTERPSLTGLTFVGVYPSQEGSLRHVDRKFGELAPARFGNYRMLEACGSTPPKNVWATKVISNESFILAEYA